MNRRSLLLAALGLTAGAGAAIAAGHAYREARSDDRHRRTGRSGLGEDRDDACRRRGGDRGRTAAADPNPAAAPVPRNGLFQNGARPKVDVQ